MSVYVDSSDLTSVIRHCFPCAIRPLVLLDVSHILWRQKWLNKTLFRVDTLSNVSLIVQSQFCIVYACVAFGWRQLSTSVYIRRFVVQPRNCVCVGWMCSAFIFINVLILCYNFDHARSTCMCIVLIRVFRGQMFQNTIRPQEYFPSEWGTKTATSEISRPFSTHQGANYFWHFRFVLKCLLLA